MLKTDELPFFPGDEGINVGGGTEIPESGLIIDNHTLVITNGIMRVKTTNDVAQDNTLPITSAGVNTIVGNINELLKII